MSRNWLAGLLLSAALVATSHAADATGALADGDAALARFDLEGAIKSYRVAHHEAPDNYEAAWKLARSLLDKGTLTKDRDAQKPLFTEAEQLARAAVELKPNESKGHVYLSIAVGKIALFEGGKRKVELSKEIKIEADKAIALNPQEDVAYHVLGVWNREMAELNWFLRTVAETLYGSFPSASLQAAETNLQQAVKLMPTAVAHRTELGITLAAERKWPEAKASLDTALHLPKAWATDDYYKAKATEALERVHSHL